MGVASVVVTVLVEKVAASVRMVGWAVLVSR